MKQGGTNRENPRSIALCRYIAFEVDDVESTLEEIISAGGSSVGELVTAPYPDDLEAVFVYAKDPEGNIVELQSWKKVKNCPMRK